MGIMEETEALQTEERIRVSDNATRPDFRSTSIKQLDKMELIQPDNTDFFVMGAVLLVEFLILYFMNTLSTAYTGDLTSSYSTFSDEIIVFLQYRGTYIYFSVLYLAYWCWRFGYYGIGNMVSEAKRRQERLLNNQGMVWNMKFFGLFFAIAIYLLSAELSYFFRIALG